MIESDPEVLAKLKAINADLIVAVRSSADALNKAAEALDNAANALTPKPAPEPTPARSAGEVAAEQTIWTIDRPRATFAVDGKTDWHFLPCPDESCVTLVKALRERLAALIDAHRAEAEAAADKAHRDAILACLAGLKICTPEEGYKSFAHALQDLRQVIQAERRHVRDGAKEEAAQVAMAYSNEAAARIRELD